MKLSFNLGRPPPAREVLQTSVLIADINRIVQIPNVEIARRTSPSVRPYPGGISGAGKSNGRPLS
jgi:hypothetical protein